jgi:hypothetical protein
MKALFVTASLLAVLNTSAQPSSAPERDVKSEFASELSNKRSLAAQEVKPNESARGQVTYNDTAVQPLRADDALQPINPAPPPDYERNLQSEFTSQLDKAGSPAAQEVKANEIASGRATYSGIAVQLLKTDNPLQLINPLAPPEYGSAEDNVIIDSFPERASPAVPDTYFGLRWKIFSIGF